MRIAYVTESFPPDVNGVAHTAMRVADHLLSRGHQPLVIAPEPASGLRRPDSTFGYPVARVPSVALPLYPGFRIGVPGQSIRAEIAAHGADLVHLAGPFVLGASGSAAARRLGLPVVAVYATDMAAYARAYHTGPVGQAICWRRLRQLHNAAARTLAPSTAAAANLAAHGIERIHLWGRGVDTSRFDPARRSTRVRARLAPGGEVIAGYVGRLAVEKRLDLLAGVASLAGSSWLSPAAARPRKPPGRRCQARCSSARHTATSSPRCTPASTSSCTPGRMTPTATRCRRRRPAGCRWWHRPQAARSTWWRMG